MGFLSNLFGTDNRDLKIRIGPKEESEGLYLRKIYAKGKFLMGEYGGSKIKTEINLRDLESKEFIYTHEPYFQGLGSGNMIFHIEEDLGYLEATQYLPKFALFGMIPDEKYLIFPYKGDRSIEVVFQIRNSDGELLNLAIEEINMKAEEYGYKELNKDRLNTQKIAIQLAAAVAASDGNIQRSELKIIKEFAKEVIDITGDEHKEKVKKELNNAIEKGISQAKKIASSTLKRVNTALLTKKVKAIGSDRCKEELLNLCLKVMAGDGTADTNELKVLEKIATEIGVDYSEYQNEKDKFMIGLDVLSNVKDDSDITSMEKTIGIKSNWDVQQKLDHLKKEFRKWNSRSGSLGDKKKEKNVQKMLDIIATLRQHYKKNKN